MKAKLILLAMLAIGITGKSITIASNATIAGQTAPGEGITIYGGRVIASVIRVVK